MTLTPIAHSSALIGAAYAPSLNAAFTELEASFGFWPIVLLPYGASRTRAQEQAVNPGGPTNSDHVKQRAVDINNQREFRNTNQALFLSILAKHGWKNVDVSGRPFPSEPWHFANQSSSPAGEGTAALDNSTTPKPQPKEDDMSYSYISRPTGPGGKPQWALLNVDFPDGAIVTQDINVANGFAAFDRNGTTIDDAHWQPSLDQAKINADRHWARVAASTPAGSVGTVTIDNSDVVAAINALAAKIPTKGTVELA